MSSKITIEKWNLAVDGALTIGNMKRKLHDLGYDYTMYTFCPGTTFPDHTHEISKKDAIATGKFEFTMFGETVVLGPGDLVDVPKDTVHNAKVVGSENVVFFDSTSRK